MKSAPVKLAKAMYRAHAEKRERDAVTALMREKDAFCRIENKAPGDVKRVAFLMQGLPMYAGGATSILRIGTYLAAKGLEISYLDISGIPLSLLRENAAFNLPGFRGEIGSLNGADPDGYDVVIATTWLSFYRLGRFHAYKMYFVQDYEPYLCENYESFLLARRTYEAGAHIVSLGDWNLRKIREECGADTPGDAVPFAYEPAEYFQAEPRDFDAYPQKKKVRIAVYAKEEGKRIPHVVQNMLAQAKEIFSERGIVLEILFFGYRKGYKPLAGQNLGLLPKAALRELYANADFGMCASMTNISLVTYEMIATGLPVIEFAEGSFPAYFPENAAILTGFDPQAFSEQLLSVLQDPEGLRAMTARACETMKAASWEKSGEAFFRILTELPSRC